MIFHVLHQKASIAVCSKHMEVAVLMVFAYNLTDHNEKWVMKVETNKLICIRKNVEYLGTNVSIKFPQTHTVTGCDNFFFIQCWGKCFNKFLKSFSMEKKS